MTIHFQVTIEHFPAPGAFIDGKPASDPLYSSVWFDVSYRERCEHKDGSVTQEAMIFACPFFRFVMVDLDEIRRAVRELQLVIPPARHR